MNQDSSSPKPPVTDRGRRTREKLLRAAEHVFGKKSYHHASIADIARKAGVALGSFYVYFADKKSIFVELIDELGARMRLELSEAVGGETDRLAVEIKGLRAFFGFADKHRLLYRIVREAEFVAEEAFSRYYKRLAKSYARGLEQAAKDGQVNAPDPEALAYALMGMADFLGMRFVLWGDAKDRERVIGAASEFLQHGLAPRRSGKLVAVPAPVAVVAAKKARRRS